VDVECGDTITRVLIDPDTGCVLSSSPQEEDDDHAHHGRPFTF
jgi:hypothetical protein